MAIRAHTAVLVASATLAFGSLVAVNVVHTLAQNERRAVISDLRAEVSHLTQMEKKATDAAQEAVTAEVEIRVLIAEQDTVLANTDGFIE